MNRTALAATATAALLLLLTGCSGGGESDAVMGSPTPLVGASPASEAPLTAESPSEAPSASSTDAAFLEQVRDALPDDTVIPNATDGQLLAAAQKACEQMSAGTDPSAVAVIEGEPVNGLEIHEDSAAIAIAARKTICP